MNFNKILIKNLLQNFIDFCKFVFITKTPVILVEKTETLVNSDKLFYVNHFLSTYKIYDIPVQIPF